MANFFLDNDDILFHFEHDPLAECAELQEDGFGEAQQYDYAPSDAADAVDSYRRVMESLGELAGDFIAPRAEDVDREGNTLDGNRVTYSRGMRECLDMLGKADAMGFTLPRRFGGLNCPNLLYTMAIEMVSRADTSLMNLFGLQGIAETIDAFASEEIKQEYLPRFSTGELTGAMVLTEPDAGSDLQRVKLRADEGPDGWRLNGVKRFITNGCGDVLLVLARSEPDTTDGMGLSLLLCERQDRVRVRRLEDKLGIHGSPTCELQFNDVPAKLIGERQRGLVTYVMQLMNGARVGIAAQSIGVAQAAYNEARRYAKSREQFGVAIERFPAVTDLLVRMQIGIEAARAVTYETSYWVDVERSLLRKLADPDRLDKSEQKQVKREQRRLKRLVALLTPISKYYSSEMAVRVTNDAIQVLGGSGFMRDYPLERHLRDARITTIYEGTSQLQILAAIRGVVSGQAEKRFVQLADMDYDPEWADALEQLAQARVMLESMVATVKEQGSTYTDLYARPVVDAAIDIYVGYLFLGQASVSGSAHKRAVAKRFMAELLPRVQMIATMVGSGDTTSLDAFDELIGKVPE